VLVIDDEPDIREITQLSLERLAGWHVDTAANGTEGETLALNEQPEAILLDVMMPELDGEATARAIRAHTETHDTPIVLMSAASELPEWAGELGVRGLVAKPFDPMTLADEVRTHLGW
jgi:DNA-binding response OmpR family regulator